MAVRLAGLTNSHPQSVHLPTMSVLSNMSVLSVLSVLLQYRSFWLRYTAELTVEQEGWSVTKEPMLHDKC